MSETELKLLNNVFDLAIAECPTQDIKHIRKLQEKIINSDNIIKEVRECVETAISEDYYDGGIYKIKKILDRSDDL